jgi:type II secretory ATPase GspE/PulE/Tfp pilus assembly ATPase PilB-like protein
VAVKSSLIDALADKNLLSADQIQICQIESRKSGHRLERVAVDLGFISNHQLRDIRGESSGRRSVSLADALPDGDALAFVPEPFARQHQLVPLSFDADKQLLTVAVADLHQLQAQDRLRARLGRDVTLELVMASERDIAEAIDRFYGFELSVDSILLEIDTANLAGSASSVQEDNDQPFVRLVDAILVDAVRRSASDIHIEPEAGFMRIRYRIDGVLREVRSFHQHYQAPMTVRIKVLADLDISESRAPQDGRISFTVAGSPIEFRVSTLPTVHGENIVLRVLDRQRGIVSIDQLGLHPDALASVRLMMARPEGLILVTGPTGSGKTTTLYSMLSDVSNPSVNVMTMEDPVEYPLPLLRQTMVNEQARLDFASGIRAILRQDPDIILLGEMRDEETAEMAMRAAMTGHQVYSTLHANTAVGAISRLSDMGVDRSTMAGNIIGIVGQRLVRLLCSHCKREREPDAFEQSLLGDCMQVYEAVGCARCDQQGYRGRAALTEVLRFTDVLDDMLLAAAPPSELVAQAKSTGFRLLADDALSRVLAGDTTLDEVSRVIDFTNYAH